MKTPSKKQVLGRGLSALFETMDEPVTPEKEDKYQLINISLIIPGKYQPRQKFNEKNLEELASSIQDKGILQPLLVRFEEGRYDLIAGERRLKGAHRAGLTHVPCYLLDVSPEEAFEISLLENVQRDDLSCLEEAKGYKKLVDDYFYTQEKISQKIGKSRSHIANMLRLLTLPPMIQDLVDQEKITAGHARALISATDPVALAHLIVEKDLNVRQTEKLAQGMTLDNLERDQIPVTFKRHKPSEKGTENKEAELLLQQLQDLTGLKIYVTLKKEGGAIEFGFKNMAQLDDFLQHLTQGYGPVTIT